MSLAEEPFYLTLLTQLSQTDEFSGASYCSSPTVKVDTVSLVTVRLPERSALPLNHWVRQWVTNEYTLMPQHLITEALINNSYNCVSLNQRLYSEYYADSFVEDAVTGIMLSWHFSRCVHMCRSCLAGPQCLSLWGLIGLAHHCIWKIKLCCSMEQWPGPRDVGRWPRKDTNWAG